MSIFDSFKKKFAYVTQLTKNHLMQKYEMIMNQLSYLDYITDQVKQIKNEIERDIRSEYCEMIDEITSIEGKKLAVINYESAILQKDITKIQEIMNYINELNGCESPDMISFLLRYKQLNDSIEYAIAKPIKQKIDIAIDDFPRKQQENKRKIENYNKLEKLLKLKDDIIWTIVNDKQKSQQTQFNGNNSNIYKSNIEKEKELKVFKEIEEWAKLSEKYAQELQKYHLVCCFCGCYLDENTVNSDCNINTLNNSANMYYDVNINEDIRGTNRHYFISPPNTDRENNNNFNMRYASNPVDKEMYNEINYK